jgi:HD-GYP domain-containing protein (c-di-GMP phosphodiesterase class II)
MAQVRVSEILAALSFGLDLTEGQPFGHSLRSCLIGTRIGLELGLPLEQQRDLYYALLLKDVGCSSNAARIHELFGGDDRVAKHDVRRVEWTNVVDAAQYAVHHAAPGGSWFERLRRLATLARGGTRVANELVEARCTRGARIVEQLGFGPDVAAAVAASDEHWDGRGRPNGRRGEEIPLLGRIICLAQTMEVFASVDGARGALDVARSRRGSWFDPALVDVCATLEREIDVWYALDEWGLHEAVRDFEPGDVDLLAGPGALDRIASAFAAVVDAKSHYTALHSARVTAIAVQMAESLGMEAQAVVELRRAALLHDLGKLSVPNSILDKPGPLTAEEWETMRLHPYYTQRILDHVSGFQELAFVASSHHERLDGRGYFRGLRAEQIPLGARILAVADIFEALTAERPYRPALLVEVAYGMMERDRGIGLDADCLDALARLIEDGSALPEVSRHAA